MATEMPRASYLVSCMEGEFEKTITKISLSFKDNNN